MQSMKSTHKTQKTRVNDQQRMNTAMLSAQHTAPQTHMHEGRAATGGTIARCPGHTARPGGDGALREARPAVFAQDNTASFA